MRKNYGKRKWILFGGTAVIALSLGACRSEKNTILTPVGVKYESSLDDTKLTIGKDGKVYVEYKDDNGNGIPDEIEDMYANKSTNEIFSVTLGSAIALIVNVIYLIYNITKTKKANAVANQRITEMCSDSVKFVNEFKESAKTNAASTSEVVAQNKALISRLEASEKVNSDQTEQIKALKESNEALTKGYSDINAQMNTILANQAVMANTPDNTKYGINRIVQANTKEALRNGRKDKEA